MFNQKDLYAALQNGENPEKIAQQFADALNGAIAQQKKEADEAKAKAEAAAKAQARIAAIDGILNAVQEFIKEFYPDMYDPDMRAQVKAEEIDKMIYQAYEETQAMMGPLKELMKMRQQYEAQQAKAMPVEKKPVLKTAANVTPRDADAALKAFLTRNGF